MFGFLEAASYCCHVLLPKEFNTLSKFIIKHEVYMKYVHKIIYLLNITEQSLLLKCSRKMINSLRFHITR